MLDRLLECLKNGKDKVFYCFGEEYITYQDFYEKVIELSNNLRKQGNLPVILYGGKSIDQVLSIISCLVAKRCYISIDVFTPVERILEIIEQSNASLLIKNEDCDDSNFRIECLNIKEINEKYSKKLTFFENKNDKAYLIFTSGSTGKPKGVPIKYSNLEHFIEWIMNCLELKDYFSMNVLSQASFSFDLSIMDLYFSIYKNCTIFGIDSLMKKDMAYLFNVLKEKSIQFLILTPTFVKMLLLDPDYDAIQFPNIQCFFFCGECLEVETVRKLKNRFPNVSIVNAYGPTEATCCVSLIEITDKMLEQKLLPVGRISTSAVDILIDDGEIILKGKSVFDGYLNLYSEKVYLEDDISCYKTGDVGFIQDDYLYCKGRKDQQIKYQGYRIELGDIEQNLLFIEEIEEAVVVAKKDENTNVVKFIKAFVVLNQEIEIDIIKNKLSKLLPSYMIPKRIVILGKMPVNVNGKYDRKVLEQL